MTRTVFFALAAVVAACGSPSTRPAPGAQQSRPVVAFPQPSRLVAAVEAGPPPDLAPLLPRGEVAVDGWTIESTPAPGDPVYEPEGAYEPILDAAVAERGVRVTRSASLRCVAQETARFYAQHDGLPTDRLTGYLLAACGSSALGVGRAGTLGTVDPRSTDAQIVEGAADDLRAQLAPALVDGALVGLGVHRDGTEVSIVLAVADPAVRLTPPEPPDATGEAVLRGRYGGQADAVFGLVNQGAHGVTRCRADPSIRLPQIVLRCPIAETDGAALVHVGAMTVGRVLTEHLASVLVRRPEAAIPPYVAVPGGASGTAGASARPPGAPSDASPSSATADPAGEPSPAETLGHDETLVAQLNAIRRAAGLAEVTLSPTQSAVHREVAPYMLASILQGEASQQDVLALGLLAGWEVTGGTIRWADIVGQTAVGSRDPSRWLAEALSQPSGRFVLMRPDVRQIAVGSVSVDEPEAIGLVVTTYAFFESSDHSVDADRYFARITRERTARGLPPPQRMEGVGPLFAHARAVSEGREPPHDALRAGLDESSRAQRRNLAGLLLETIDLDVAPLPDAVFERRDLTLGLAVGHTRAPGAAWGQYVVFLMFPAAG